jgi:DNA-binding LacI/PurR family transcriptional regulator
MERSHYASKRSQSDSKNAATGEKRPGVNSSGASGTPVERVRPPSITDVAKLANVSYQTVSRVLNGHPHVRPATRAAVIGAIEQLGYRPSNAARTLVTGRSRTLGVLALDVEDWDGLTPLYGIERSAREMGYFVGIGNLDSVNRASIRAAADRLAEQSVAGLLVIAPIEAASDALTTLPPDLPVVAIEGDPSQGLATVACDQAAGARAATEHLLELGHETVFHVRGPLDWMQTQDRVAGWRAALEAADAEVPMPLAGDWTARSGYEAGLILARIPELTAVFAGNDLMALGLLRAFSERGIAVPHDVSIVGFDDGPEADYYTPPLTTVHQPFQAVGRRGVEMLIEQVETHTRSSERCVIEPELVVRASAAAPTSGARR